MEKKKVFKSKADLEKEIAGNKLPINIRSPKLISLILKGLKIREK